jgi:hypothetical protein
VSSVRYELGFYTPEDGIDVVCLPSALWIPLNLKSFLYVKV